MSETPPIQTNEVFQEPPPQAHSQPVVQTRQHSVPVESVALPSKGKLYPLDHPLCNEEHVDIRCMTAREEDLLTSASLIKNGTVMTRLISACLMNKTIDPDSLLPGDRNAILIAIRVTGYGANYSVKLSCPHCSQEYEKDFSVARLGIKSLGENPVQPNYNLFKFTLPLSNEEVHFRLLTGKDELEIEKAQARKKKLGIQVEQGVTSRLIQSIVSIGSDREPEIISKAINQMRAGDARALRKHMAEISPSVDMTQKTECSHCGEESEVEVPLGLNFFWPDLDE